MGCEQSTTVEPIKEINNIKNGVKSLPNGFGLNHIHPEKAAIFSMEHIRLLLKEYADSESKIAEFEKGDPLTMFYIKKSLLFKLEEKLSEQLEKVECLQKERSKRLGSKQKKEEKLKDLVRKSAKKERLTKEEHDNITTTNRLEIALTELEMLHQERVVLEKEVGHLLDILCTLKDQYERQDIILEDLEINDDLDLQKSLAELEEQRIKTSEIYERWREGRKLVSEACRQISNSLKYWKQMISNERDQYEVAEEIRDGFVTALQCLSNAKFFIRIDFAYCTGMELATLEKSLWAMTYLFIDMNREDRRVHASSCYMAFHKRAAALFTWIDKSIEIVIEPDLKQLSCLINDKVRELRFRRMSFIKEKFPELMMSELLEKSFNPRLPEAFNSNYASPSGSSPSSSVGINSINSPDPEKVKYTCRKYPDEDTGRIIAQLDLDRLAPVPSKYEMYEKQNERIIEKIKAKIRESFMRRSTARRNFTMTVDKVLSIHRSNKLKARKNMILMESESSVISNNK